LINGKPKDEGERTNLGDWEFERMKGGAYLQAGVYYIEYENGKIKDRTRGGDRKKIVLIRQT
jgi:hypothetical protein